MVTVAVSAAANTITITPCDAAGVATAPPDVINAGTGTVITWGVKHYQRFNYTGWDRWGNIAPPATPANPDYLPALTHYQVFIKQNGLPKIYTLDLTLVFGQPTWTNDEAGVAVAIGDLDAAIP